MILSTVCWKLKTNLHYCWDATKRRLNAVFFLLHSIFVPKDCNAISAHIQKFHVELFFLFLELKDCVVVVESSISLVVTCPLPHFVARKCYAFFWSRNFELE